MKRLILFVFLSLLSVPQAVGATGIVPACKVGEAGCENPYAPENYGGCEFVALVNNTLEFVVGLTALIAVFVFIYAGFLFVIARGDTSLIQQGKRLFSNVLIGFIIVFSAFLVVNTVVSMLMGTPGDSFSWSRIDCSYSNESGTPAPFKIVVNEEQYQALFTEAGYGTMIGGLGEDQVAASAGVCSGAAINEVWGNLGSQANCIIEKESACGAAPVSRVDVGADRNPFSYGPMQINMTVHEVKGCSHLGYRDMRCLDAWSGRNFNARVTNETLFKDCRAALLNPECNMINGKRIYQEAGNSWRPWSTARSCRLR